MSEFKFDDVAKIIRDAGGVIVGRTRLQKIAYLLTVTGLDDNFDFAYKHYGPFSEQLASSAKLGALFGNLSEEQAKTQWGGSYSTYSVEDDATAEQEEARVALATLAAKSESIELELAATAVFLKYDGFDDPWAETSRRKPEKATTLRIKNAKSLLLNLKQISVPSPLPDIV